MAHDLDKFSHAGIRKSLGYPDRLGEQPSAPVEHRRAPGGIAESSKRMATHPTGGIAPSSHQLKRKPGPILSNEPRPAGPVGQRDHPTEA
jgi:hypothetical protein